MQLNEKQKLLKALKNGTVTVTFQKIGTGEIRVMPCTLNPKVLKAEGVNIQLDMNADSDNFAVWSLDKTAWRSFVLDTVKGWEVLGE